MFGKIAFIRTVVFVSFSFTAAADGFSRSGFVREECLKQTLDNLANGKLAPNDEVFMRDAAGRPMSDPKDLTLTLSGCNKLCGPEQRWYSDIGPRVSVWLLPVLLLVSNIELSPLDKRRFYAIFHLLGDPIHSFWSIIDKIDAWDRCYRLAEQYEPDCERCRRVIATVFAGFEEIRGPEMVSKVNLSLLVDEHNLTDKFKQWRRAAVEFADSRTDEFFRTCLAILLFIYQLIAGFVKEVGGESSSPPGGRVATGVLLSWLIPIALLSNAVGNFTSRYTCWDILSRFAERTGGRLELPDSESVLLQGFPALARTCRTPYIESLAWSGGIYTYRPSRRQNTNAQRSWFRAIAIFSISIFPICIGMLGGFIILWYLIPNGLNCRHLWMIGVVTAWFASAMITKMSHSARFVTGKYHLHFVLAKDTLIAIPSIAIIFLSASGLFNSCKCWSGYLYYGKGAHVALNTEPFFERNDRTIYPLVFGVCLAAQLALFGTVAAVWRRGFKVFRWSESARREERARATGNTVCTCTREKFNVAHGTYKG
ncbi:MAG: hypothetical protein Q9214_004516 [Letrouitia sp. 1 TL-2023]